MLDIARQAGVAVHASELAARCNIEFDDGFEVVGQVVEHRGVEFGGRPEKAVGHLLAMGDVDQAERVGSWFSNCPFGFHDDRGELDGIFGGHRSLWHRGKRGGRNGGGGRGRRSARDRGGRGRCDGRRRGGAGGSRSRFDGSLGEFEFGCRGLDELGSFAGGARGREKAQRETERQKSRG